MLDVATPGPADYLQLHPEALQFLPETDVFLPNTDEAALILGETDPVAAGRRLPGARSEARRHHVRRPGVRERL